MRPVNYLKSTSWSQASKALKANPKARAIAGGSDLLGWVKDNLQGKGSPRWDTFVDIRTIKDADHISFSKSSGLKLGALTTLASIEGSKDVQENYPILAKAAGAAASPNIRAAGTIGGNLNQRPRCWFLRNAEFDCYKKGGDQCFAVTGQNTYHAILGGEKCFIVHPSDTAPALMALNASAKITGPSGDKTVSFDKYFIGPREDVLRENILQQGDLLTEIEVPAVKAGTGMSFIKAQRRGQTYDFALANVAAVITKKDGKVTDARIVLSGVAPVPWRATQAEDAIMGKTVDAKLAAEAADKALAGARAMTYNGYKVTLAKTLVTRAILEATA